MLFRSTAEEVLSAEIATRSDLNGSGGRIQINRKLTETNTGSSYSSNTRSLFDSSAGLLIATSDLATGELSPSYSSAQASAYDPGVVLLRDTDGNPITSSSSDPANPSYSNYQIDGKTVTAARRLTSTYGSATVTTGFEVFLKNSSGQVTSEIGRAHV